jgi:hypothetical protein
MYNINEKRRNVDLQTYRYPILYKIYNICIISTLITGVKYLSPHLRVETIPEKNRTRLPEYEIIKYFVTELFINEK